MTTADVLAVPFFASWLSDRERVGYWVGSTEPPGDTALSVARRIRAFAGSLPNMPGWRGRTVVGITHSPVLRSIGVEVTGSDPGEPKWLHGYEFAVRADGSMDIEAVGPAVG